MKVELIRPDFWAGKEVLDALLDATRFVTGDDWEFEFKKDSAHYQWTRPLLCRGDSQESPLVCLYSGGLDSAAGLGLRISEQPGRLFLPVAVHHQPGQRKRVTNQFGILRRHFNARIEPLVVNTMVYRNNGGKSEPSGRGRPVLFGALGAIAADLAGASGVEVFESGVGAINIPLMAGMTGSRSTRSCHPEFMRRMSRLVSLVAGRDIIFRLPFRDLTKGEMVRALKEVGLADLARQAISCAHFPQGYRCYQQCGTCSACIFRRQAMIVAGIKESQGSYSFDLFDSAEAANKVPLERLMYLKAFLMQASSWNDIEEATHIPEPHYRYLVDTQVLKCGESPGAIIELLVRYGDEWRAVAAERGRHGFHWARWLGPVQPPNGKE